MTKCASSSNSSRGEEMGYSAEQIDFIKRIAPIVQRECIKRGYSFASPILAQASTESFKGSSLSKLAKNYNNFFGMKCGRGWKGKSINLSTGEEYVTGTISIIQANFRVYDTLAEGIVGYFDFINTKRYANLKTAISPRHYLELIKQDGYATSSRYVTTCMERIQGLNLTQYDTFNGVAKTENPYAEPTKNIRLNSKGNDVRWLQYELNRVGGYKLIVDGIAGELTIACLKNFQKTHGLVDDGICGPLTRQKLKSI